MDADIFKKETGINLCSFSLFAKEKWAGSWDAVGTLAIRMVATGFNWFAISVAKMPPSENPSNIKGSEGSICLDNLIEY